MPVKSNTEWLGLTFRFIGVCAIFVTLVSTAAVSISGQKELTKRHEKLVAEQKEIHSKLDEIIHRIDKNLTKIDTKQEMIWEKVK